MISKNLKDCKFVRVRKESKEPAYENGSLMLSLHNYETATNLLKKGWNVGVVGIDNVVCIDIDDVGFFESLKKEKDEMLNTYTEQTPSGGRHLIYKYESNEAPINRDVTHVVELRSINRYVVISPSVLVKDGIKKIPYIVENDVPLLKVDNKDLNRIFDKAKEYVKSSNDESLKSRDTYVRLTSLRPVLLEDSDFLTNYEVVDYVESLEKKKNALFSFEKKDDEITPEVLDKVKELFINNIIRSDKIRLYIITLAPTTEDCKKILHLDRSSRDFAIITYLVRFRRMKYVKFIFDNFPCGVGRLKGNVKKLLDEVNRIVNKTTTEDYENGLEDIKVTISEMDRYTLLRYIDDKKSLFLKDLAKVVLKLDETNDDRKITTLKHIMKLKLGTKNFDLVNKVEKLFDEILYSSVEEDVDDGLTEEPYYVVDDFIRNKTLTLMFGESSSRKSFIAIELARALTTGTKFLGKIETTPKKVLYLYSDSDSLYDVKSRQELLGCKFEVLKVNSNVNNLIQIIRKSTADVVIIDSLAGVLPSSNQEEDVEKFFSKLKRKSTKALVIIDHVKKIDRETSELIKIGQVDVTSLNSLNKGSTRKVAAADTVMFVSKVNGELSNMMFTKFRHHKKDLDLEGVWLPIHFMNSEDGSLKIKIDDNFIISSKMSIDIIDFLNNMITTDVVDIKKLNKYWPEHISNAYFEEMMESRRFKRLLGEVFNKEGEFLKHVAFGKIQMEKIVSDRLLERIDTLFTDKELEGRKFKKSRSWDDYLNSIDVKISESLLPEEETEEEVVINTEQRRLLT